MSSDSLDKGMYGSKDYDLKKLELVNSGGQTIDLSKIFVEMQIFQDIYSSVMHGNILLNDANDLFNNFTLCGNEYLVISVDKPSLGKPLEKIFRIYKATDRKPSKNSSQAYILHFCSDEFILSNSMRVSKAYKQSKASDIVMDIMTNILKVDRTKLAKFEETAGVYDFIVPNYRPFEAIQWAVGRSYDTKPKFCYFFYENTDGYNFQSLQSLYAQPAIKKMKYEIKRVDTDPSTNKDSIDDFSIVNDFDMLTSISNGAFASKLIAVDIFSQTFRTYNYSLSTAEGQGSLLNKYKPINEPQNINRQTPSTSYDSYISTYVQINDTKSERENSVEKWLMPRALHMSLINTFKFKGVLPGDITLKAGDVVEYVFPKFTAPDESGKEKDEFRSGKYLVTAINHTFKQDVFETIAEFATDSFASPIGAAKDLSSITKKKGI